MSNNEVQNPNPNQTPIDQTINNSQHNQTPIDQTINNSQQQILQTTTQPQPINQNKYGYCLIVLFICVIITAILLIIFIQSNPQQVDEQQIVDQPYKAGDQTVETYDLVKLNTTYALCLDGSPAYYYIAKTGDPSRLLLFFEQGGWCSGSDSTNTLRNCLYRSTTNLGSSLFSSQTITFSNTIMSKEPKNPFRNWKKIYLNYCDGSGHQGSKKQPVQIDGKLIFFRGHHIKLQIFQDLQLKLGLFSKVNRLVISGWSAGALAVYTWANYLTDRLQNGIVYAISDAGIFYDAQNKHTKIHSYRQQIINLMKFTNAQIDPPTPQCIQDFPNDKVNCMFAQYLYKYVKAPIFVLQSLQDTWSLPNILGINCFDFRTCSESDNKIIEQNRKNITRVLEEIGSNKRNGVFATSCPLHEIILTPKFTNEKFTIPLNSSFTASKSIQQWFRYPRFNNFHLDLDSWYNISMCH